MEVYRDIWTINLFLEYENSSSSPSEGREFTTYLSLTTHFSSGSRTLSIQSIDIFHQKQCQICTKLKKIRSDDDYVVKDPVHYRTLEYNAVHIEKRREDEEERNRLTYSQRFIDFALKFVLEFVCELSSDYERYYNLKSFLSMLEYLNIDMTDDIYNNGTSIQYKEQLLRFLIHSERDHFKLRGWMESETPDKFTIVLKEFHVTWQGWLPNRILNILQSDHGIWFNEKLKLLSLKRTTASTKIIDIAKSEYCPIQVPNGRDIMFNRFPFTPQGDFWKNVKCLVPILQFYGNPSRLEIFTSMRNYFGPSHNDKELRQGMRRLLEELANIPQVYDPRGLEIQPYLFQELVSAIMKHLNEITESNITTSLDKVCNGLNTIRKLEHKTFKIVFENEFSCIAFSYDVRCLTSVEYLEDFIKTKIMNPHKKYDGLSDPNKNGYMFLYNGNILRSEVTLYEAILSNNENKTDVFNVEHRFLCKEKTKIDVPVHEEPPVMDLLYNYLRMNALKIDDCPDNKRIPFELIHILYGINKYWNLAYKWFRHYEFIIDPKNFYHEKLDDQVYEILMDPFLVLVGRMPCWLKTIVHQCPFLFSLETRKLAYKIFNGNRRDAAKAVLDRCVQVPQRNPLYNMEMKEGKLLKVGRKQIFEDIKEILHKTRRSSKWRLMFRDEPGAGPGIKRETFSTVGRELLKPRYNIWSEGGQESDGMIYPVAGRIVDLASEDIIDIGRILGKAFQEGTIVDLPLAPGVFRWFLDLQLMPSLEDMKYVNPSVYKVLQRLDWIITDRDEILFNEEISPEKQQKLINDLNVDGYTVEDFGLYFVVPGSDDIELIENGANTQVTICNVHKYVSKVLKHFLREGIKKTMLLLKQGFNDMVNLDSLKIFEPEELRDIICGDNESEYWTQDHLEQNIILQNCTLEDSIVIDLLDILLNSPEESRNNFLKFVTGCSALPIGGFANLVPPFTIHCSGNNPPSVHTCFNLLRLPNTLSRDLLQQFFDVAIKVGLDSFDFI